MPTWPGRAGVPSAPGIMTRSPARAWDRLVGEGMPELVRAAAWCGRATPAAAQAAMVSPEQSKASGPAAAPTEGLPRWAGAYRTAAVPCGDPLMTSPAGTVVVPATLLPYGPTMLPAGMAPPAPAQIAGPASSADRESVPAASEPVRIAGDAA